MTAALKPQINDRVAADVDRSGCPADRHGTRWYCDRYGCICPDALASSRRYGKLKRAGTAPTGRIPIVGTARRLQALAVNGWTCTALAKRWDCNWQQLAQWRSADRPTIHRLNAAFIARNYDVLRDVPGGSWQTTLWAKKRGCLSPAQLATFDVDDPVAGPRPQVFVPRGRVHLDEVRYLRESGVSDDDIAETFGVQVGAIRVAERRSRKGAA